MFCNIICPANQRSLAPCKSRELCFFFSIFFSILFFFNPWVKEGGSGPEGQPAFLGTLFLLNTQGTLMYLVQQEVTIFPSSKSAIAFLTAPDIEIPLILTYVTAKGDIRGERFRE